MNVKVKLVNKHKSATADLWNYSGRECNAMSVARQFCGDSFSSAPHVCEIGVRVLCLFVSGQQVHCLLSSAFLIVFSYVTRCSQFHQSYVPPLPNAVSFNFAITTVVHHVAARPPYG